MIALLRNCAGQGLDGGNIFKFEEVLTHGIE